MALTIKKPNTTVERAEVRRLVSMANKRLRRLEQANLTVMPRYQAWIKGGGEKFSVKGKQGAELNAEYRRIQHFLDSTTSTVRGAKQTIKNISESIGVEVNVNSNGGEATVILSNFFALADRLKQYYRSLGETAKALNYLQIFKEVRMMIEDGTQVGDELLDVGERLENYINKLDDFEANGDIDIKI